MSKHRKKNLPTEFFEADIETLSHDGRGIAHLDGKTIFISNALPNEKVLFKYTNKRGSFDEGETVELLKKAKDRVEPPCPHYSICGGCNLQHLNSEAQIKHKQQILLDQLQHFGKVTPQEILAPLTSSNSGYRNKARLGVRFVPKKNKVLVGFREKNGRYIAELENCVILHPAVGKKLIAISELISSLKNFQVIPQIEIAVGDKQTALVIRHLKPLPVIDIEKIIVFAKTNDFEIYLQPKGIDSIHKIYPEKTHPRLSYALPDYGIELLFHPCDFTQVNPELNRKLVNRVIEFLAPTKDDQILDLFCGLGNFTIPLAKHCAHIVGIEGDENMIARGKENAIHNQLSNIDFYSANLNENIANNQWGKQSYAKILLDPPRSGALEIIKQLPRFNAKCIVYVSCNPATLARDAGILVNELGYILKKAGIMDMFPHTAHVESIAVFKTNLAEPKSK